MSDGTKYGDLIEDHEWQEPDTEPEDVEPRVEVNTHTVTIDERVDDEYIVLYRWRFGVQDRQIVGWSRSDIDDEGTEDFASDLTWPEIPVDVKLRLGEALSIEDWDDHLDLPDFLRGEDDV